MSTTLFHLPHITSGKGADAKEAKKQRPKLKVSAPGEIGPAVLRDDHIVLLAIDGVLTLHAAIKSYLMRRRTRKILAALDDRQLRDIGLTRDEIASASMRSGTGHLCDNGANSRPE
jgi:uncharacterized protein YjiS (DUF1127 family)